MRRRGHALRGGNDEQMRLKAFKLKEFANSEETLPKDDSLLKVMKHKIVAVAAMAGLAVGSLAHAQVEIGGLAPGFTLRSAADGNQMTLSSLRGKAVVVEWVDFNCPAVKQLYEEGGVQTLQKKYAGNTEAPVVWVTIAVTPPGKETHMSDDVVHHYVEEYGADPSQIFIDPNLTVAPTWGVNTVPRVYVVNDEGQVVYKGGLAAAEGSDPSASLSSLDEAISRTLNSVPVTNPVQPVSSGCKIQDSDL